MFGYAYRGRNRSHLLSVGQVVRHKTAGWSGVIANIWETGPGCHEVDVDCADRMRTVSECDLVAAEEATNA